MNETAGWIIFVVLVVGALVTWLGIGWQQAQRAARQARTRKEGPPPANG